MFFNRFVIKVPLVKRLFSYFYPLNLRKGEGEINPRLELWLWRGQLQLATADAFYSDGNRYVPALTIVNHLKDFLPSVKNVLVLGSGLGSLVQIMTEAGHKPQFTLVEKDEVVLRWAMEFLDGLNANIVPVCADAREFMQKNGLKFDLVFVDIFNNLVVPDFVQTPSFLTDCRKSLNPHGRLALNYIVHDSTSWAELQKTFGQIFPGYKVVERRVNRILIS